MAGLGLAAKPPDLLSTVETKKQFHGASAVRYKAGGLDTGAVSSMRAYEV